VIVPLDLIAAGTSFCRDGSGLVVKLELELGDDAELLELLDALALLEPPELDDLLLPHAPTATAQTAASQSARHILKLSMLRCSPSVAGYGSLGDRRSGGEAAF
jgi:hypothetical protein